MSMTRKVFCLKLQKEANGLTQPPYPGDFGKKIYENISVEAWQQWLALQTMLINEHRLSMVDPKAREFLRKETEKFLFEGGEGNKPDGFTPKS